MSSPRLDLDDIIVGQAAKEVVVNGNSRRLEAWFGVKSRSNGGPPGSPADGDAYIVDSLTGLWSSFALDDLAIYYNGSWRNIPPSQGPLVYVDDEDLRLSWDGAAWTIAVNSGAINTQTVNYTTVLTDSYKYIRMDLGTPLTCTIPPSASVNYPLGTTMTIRRVGVGTVTIIAGAGVTFNGSISLPAQNDSVTLVKVDTDNWDAY